MRLIDADELQSRLLKESWWDNADIDIAYDIIQEAPTVIMSQAERECAKIVYHNRPISRKVIYVEEDNSGNLHCNCYGRGKPLVLMNNVEHNLVPYCGKCNARLSDDFLNYCPRCGVKIDLEDYE